MKKIMFICNRLGGGGAERVITILANELVKIGYESCFCVFRGHEDTYEIDSSITIKQLFDKSENISKLQKVKRLRNTIKQYNPDTIISFEYFVNMETIIAVCGMKCKVIISERNDPARVGGKFPKNVIRNFLYRFCDILVCQTPDAKAYFPKALQKKIVVIPNPIKENLPKPWKGKRKKEIVNFCRLEKQKNLPLLIDAFEQVYAIHLDYSLHIYGDGKEKDFLQQYISDKNLQGCVFIHSAVNNIHEKVLKSAIFVSSSDYEGLSNSMLEAMAIGLPTICTDCPCGGARMIIENRVNGMLVSVRDVNEMKKAIETLIYDTKLSELISCNALNVKHNLSIKRISEKWIRLID